MRLITKFVMFIFLCCMPYKLIYSSSIDNDRTPESIRPTDLKDFDRYKPSVQKLIKAGLKLTERKLGYIYASHDPKNGGMDCSGTIHYLLKSTFQLDVPVGTDTLYDWIVKNGKFYSVTDTAFDSKQFNQLKPGDLLFWTGTWEVKRKSPLSHVMLYLGTDQQGNRLMFGASNGRTYKGKRIWGVSVFDFKLPAKDSKARFIGYSCIPTINCEATDVTD